MRKKRWVFLAMFLMVPVMLGTVSCAKKTVTKEEPAPEQVPEAPEPAPAPTVEEEAAKMAEIAKSEFINENIYFDFDRSNLDARAQATLRKKAQFLKTYPDVYTTIEGHCDERGTSEYNLALGERRAESAKSFLIDMGIEAYRISTVSFGEERPTCTEKNEACWSKNRRDEFIIK